MSSETPGEDDAPPRHNAERVVAGALAVLLLAGTGKSAWDAAKFALHGRATEVELGTVAGDVTLSVKLYERSGRLEPGIGRNPGLLQRLQEWADISQIPEIDTPRVVDVRGSEMRSTSVPYGTHELYVTVAVDGQPQISPRSAHLRRSITGETSLEGAARSSR